MTNQKVNATYTFDPFNATLTISASFAKKASKVGSPEYEMILKLRKDFPTLTIKQEAKREGKKCLNYKKMAEFISMHRNSKELLALFEKVKKLSHVQPMPYKYVETWFNNNFPYYSDQPTFDADGYVVDNSTLTNAAEMMRDVKKGMQDAANIIPVEANVA